MSSNRVRRIVASIVCAAATGGVLGAAALVARAAGTSGSHGMRVVASYNWDPGRPPR